MTRLQRPRSLELSDDAFDAEAQRSVLTLPVKGDVDYVDLDFGEQCTVDAAVLDLSVADELALLAMMDECLEVDSDDPRGGTTVVGARSFRRRPSLFDRRLCGELEGPYRDHATFQEASPKGDPTSADWDVVEVDGQRITWSGRLGDSMRFDGLSATLPRVVLLRHLLEAVREDGVAATLFVEIVRLHPDWGDALVDRLLQLDAAWTVHVRRGLAGDHLGVLLQADSEAARRVGLRVSALFGVPGDDTCRPVSRHP